MAGQIMKILRDDIAKLQKDATKTQINKSVARGINYALGKARTQMKRAVVEEYKLPSSSVVATGNGGSIVIQKAKSTRMAGSISADISATSIAAFNPTQFKDIISHIKGGGGGGFTKISKRGAGFTSTRNLTRNTSKSGLYIEIVRGRKQRLASAFLLFPADGGGKAVAMARGKYQNTGSTKDFKFAQKGDKERKINRLNTKSVYWGVLHPASMNRWEPGVLKDMIGESARQLQLMINGVLP